MDNPIYRAAWIADPHGTLDCRHCGHELGNGHEPGCPVAPHDFVRDTPDEITHDLDEALDDEAAATFDRALGDTPDE
jgi:hypothetical protein